jgi:predicted phage terminase large subunit-like protein
MVLTGQISRADAAVEMLKRKRAQQSLHSYALNIDIPNGPDAVCPDEDLFGPARGLMAPHHALMLDHIERTMNTFMGRLMIFAPPGSAKSTYVSIVAPTWEMGRKPGSRIIQTGYAGGSTGIATKNSRRALMVAGSERYRLLWDTPPTLIREGATDWAFAMRRGGRDIISEYYAAGLTGGLTGNRATGAIVDDPMAGREEADSETMRQKIFDAYTDDLKTRLLPGAWIIIVMTRWHEDDLCGRILPDDWKGESGWVKCKDGMTWYVLNIQAKCERTDDPLGRRLGEYLWTDFFPPEHWQQYELAAGSEAQRTWQSLYQQCPTPEGSGDFTRDMFKWYGPGELPAYLNTYGATDFAVTENGGDWTESGVLGVDSSGNWWLLDWWSGQEATDVSIDKMLDLGEKYNVRMTFNEGGVIDKAIRPAINKRMRERKRFLDVRALPSIGDKRAKCASSRARTSAGCVWLPKGKPWAEELVDQLIGFPAHRRDDKYDVFGLFGRGLDQYADARVPEPPGPRGIKPFTAEWLEYEDQDEKPKVRYR